MCGAIACACSASTEADFSTTTNVSAPKREARRAVANVDDRVVGEAAVLGAHRVDVGPPGVEDAVAHARQGGDDGEDMDHREISRERRPTVRLGREGDAAATPP